MCKSTPEYNQENNFDFVNDFINDLYEDYLYEKDRIIEKQNEINISISDLNQKIIAIIKKLECDENVFNPNYSSEEDENELSELYEKLEILEKDKKNNDSYYDKICERIEKAESVITRARLVGYLDYIKNDDADEKSKIEILRTQEFERKRIARDLHDTTVQNLTMLIHKSEFAMKIMDTDQIRSKLELMTISKSLREIINDMRNIIYDLRPMSFDDMGLDVTIEREIAKYKEKGFAVNYIVEGNPEKIDSLVTITLLRIVQEACNNTVKHANASTINVKFIYNDDNYELIYSDDGKGFDYNKELEKKIDKRSGYGISIIKERAFLLSADLKITSEIGKGTEIHLIVPKKSTEEK